MNFRKCFQTHNSDSKQNKDEWPLCLLTGGNWKKSPEK